MWSALSEEKGGLFGDTFQNYKWVEENVVPSLAAALDEVDWRSSTLWLTGDDVEKGQEREEEEDYSRYMRVRC